MRSGLLLGALTVLQSGGLIASASSFQTRDDDLALLTKRRIADLSGFPEASWFANISTYLESQRPDGTWADVNYLSGCPAQRANWPIQQHWNRLITLAAAWSGANPSVPQPWAGDARLLAAASKGLDYWFSRDYTPADCVGDGGNPNKGCPCGTPGLWNTNWYGQSILIPQLCSTACLLLKDANLTASQREGCIRIPKRAYDLRDGIYGTGGRMTGANVVLIMQNSVSLGLFMENATIVKDSLSRAMGIMTYNDDAGVDGIHRDGTFLQHDGLLYNGNYGKDLLNAFIQLGGEIVGTSFAAGNATKEAMATYVRGNEWMIYINEKTRRELWDFNAVGRFVAFPSRDLQANSDINFNVSKLAKATADFTGPDDVQDVIHRLLSNGTDKLVGNKGFWASDYMVHRQNSFVVANKMISKRSGNSEAVNGANPYAYYLGQGTLFSYVQGDEYKDIMAAWDWNLIPGTTVLLGNPDAKKTSVKIRGKRDFVGVVSDGKSGLAVEDYIDPAKGTISYQKAWFYIDDTVVVVTSNIDTGEGEQTAPVVSVLDNRAKADGGAFVDSKRVQLTNSTKLSGHTLFYGGNGYLAYGEPFDLTLSEGDRTGNWSEISTSTAGVTTVPIFSAYSEISSSHMSYAFFPATSRNKLEKEARSPTMKPIVEDGVSGAMGNDKLGLAFWPNGSDSITLRLSEIGWAEDGTITVSTDQPGAYMLSSKCKHRGNGMKLVIHLTDPTQTLQSASFSVKFSSGTIKKAKKGEQGVSVSDDETLATFNVSLPSGGMAGSTVSRSVYILGF